MFPLKHLGFYEVKKDFLSIQGSLDSYHFIKGQLLQYQKTISDIHGMMEIIHFLDWKGKAEIKWHVHTDELHENWGDYLQPVSRPQ